MIHIAILKPDLLQAILDGRKTVESRLTKQQRPPWGCIAPGERIFLKVSAGPFRATAVAGRVREHDGLTPKKVDRLRQKWDRWVCGDDAYWSWKRDSRFACFVELLDVEPLSVGPQYQVQHMKAWYVLPDDASPLHETTLTEGAIRNGYLNLPASLGPVPRGNLRLALPDGSTITTDIARGRMLRWRGWRGVYADANAKSGDSVRLLETQRNRYAVSLHPGVGRRA